MKESAESIRNNQDSAPKETYLEGSLEEIKDQLFDEYMHQRLLEDYFSELEEYLEEDAVEQMRAILALHDDEEVYAALSLPRELRERRFKKMQEEIGKGADPAELMEKIVETSTKHGFSVGYHTSPYDIHPGAKGEWSIKGTEQDHRDGDRAMAYYSKKYRHLFKKKSPQYVYIVRTEPHTHKTDGNWSRASELSIVARVPFKDVFDYVEKTSRAVQKENGTV
jgi:hypothetical protein